MPGPQEPPLATLNRDIGQLETNVARLAMERAARAKAAARSSRRLRYFRFLRWFRSPAASFNLWPLALLVVGPLIAGIASFVLVNLVSSSGSLAILAFLIGAALGAALVTMFLNYPADPIVAAAIPEAEAQCKIDRTRLEDTLTELADVNRRLEPLLAQRRELATADKLQRAMLLQRNWKAMRGVEWEDFVVECCRTLGANVQRVPSPALNPGSKVPSTGNALVVVFSPRRVAAVAVSGVQPFHTAAVQQTMNELARHGCDASAIFTNARLTSGGKEFAASRNCTLIGEDAFPDFVLGKLKL